MTKVEKMENTQINVEAIDSDDSETNNVVDSVSKSSDEASETEDSIKDNVSYEDSDSVTTIETLNVPISTERSMY